MVGERANPQAHGAGRPYIERAQDLGRNDEASGGTMSIWQMGVRVCRILIAMVFHRRVGIGAAYHLWARLIWYRSGMARIARCRRVHTHTFIHSIVFRL